MHAADIVQLTVVGLAHHRIDRINVPVAFLAEGVFDDSLYGEAYTKSIGKDDGGLYVTQFLHLGAACQLAKSIADKDGCGDLLPENIAVVGEDGRVGGLFCPWTDVIASVLNARRLGTLSRLSADALREPTVAGASP